MVAWRGEGGAGGVGEMEELEEQGLEEVEEVEEEDEVVDEEEEDEVETEEEEYKMWGGIIGRNYREELSGGISGGGGGIGGVGSWAARPWPGSEMEGWMDDWRSSWGIL